MAICHDLLLARKHTSQSPICNSETKGPALSQNYKEPSGGVGPSPIAGGLAPNSGTWVLASGPLALFLMNRSFPQTGFQ